MPSLEAPKPCTLDPPSRKLIDRAPPTAESTARTQAQSQGSSDQGLGPSPSPLLLTADPIQRGRRARGAGGAKGYIRSQIEHLLYVRPWARAVRLIPDPRRSWASGVPRQPQAPGGWEGRGSISARPRRLGQIWRWVSSTRLGREGTSYSQKVCRGQAGSESARGSPQAPKTPETLNTGLSHQLS